MKSPAWFLRLLELILDELRRQHPPDVSDPILPLPPRPEDDTESDDVAKP